MGGRPETSGLHRVNEPCKWTHDVWAGIGHVTLALSPPQSGAGCSSRESEQDPPKYTDQNRDSGFPALRVEETLEIINEGARPNQGKWKWSRSVGEHPWPHLRKWLSGYKAHRTHPSSKKWLLVSLVSRSHTVPRITVHVMSGCCSRQV